MCVKKTIGEWEWGKERWGRNKKKSQKDQNYYQYQGQYSGILKLNYKRRRERERKKAGKPMCVRRRGTLRSRQVTERNNF